MTEITGFTRVKTVKKTPKREPLSSILSVLRKFKKTPKCHFSRRTTKSDKTMKNGQNLASRPLYFPWQKIVVVLTHFGTFETFETFGDTVADPMAESVVKNR